MSAIEISSGLQTVITPHGHYRFHWMGDHWKQEIDCAGGCQSIPKIWSIEGEISQDRHLAAASPTYQHLKLEQVGPMTSVAHLSGHVGPRHYSATFTFEERPEEFVVEVEVSDRGSESGGSPMATYLIESSEGRLEREDAAAAITWPNPETRLRFEAVAPSKVDANEAGMGTIRLKAIAPADEANAPTLRYRWRWMTVPGHQIWDREV